MFALFSAMVGWAQDSGKDLGLRQLKSTDITDGMQLAVQSVSSTNPLNWFQGAVAGGGFTGSKGQWLPAILAKA
ncbi:unknown [Prevotella sp. CAG:755]|nr:unknown [Prevotella sp. CAG:755]